LLDRTGPKGYLCTMSPPRTLPALADSRGALQFSLALQYFVQGLPLGLFTIAVPAYLAEKGLGAAAIGGFLGLSFLPWTLKLLWAALLDRWTYLPMGRRRPWLLLAQAGMLISLAMMLSIRDPLAQIAFLTGLCVALNAFTSLQDLATDALAVELVPVADQSRANAIMWGSKTIGAATAAAGGAWLLERFGFGASVLALAVPVALALLVSLALRERACERFLPWSRGRAAEADLEIQPRRLADVGRALWRAAQTRTSLLVTSASFFYHVALGLIGAALPVFAVHELEWSALSFSRIVASSRLFAGVFVLLFAGMLVARWGRIRVLMAGGGLMLAAVSSIALFPSAWSLQPAMTVFLFTYKTLATLLIVVFLAVSMGLCWKAISAVQFALYTAVANLGLATGPLLLGTIQGELGYGAVFVFSAALCVAMLALVRRVTLEPI
jgi:PAT family beta-lactamase induction signal transducer AmpG